jgi:hypothetical protein
VSGSTFLLPPGGTAVNFTGSTSVQGVEAGLLLRDLFVTGGGLQVAAALSAGATGGAVIVEVRNSPGWTSLFWCLCARDYVLEFVGVGR